VLCPLPDIAMHVIESPRVGLQLPHRMRLPSSILIIPCIASELAGIIPKAPAGCGAGARCRGITRAQVPLVVVGYTIFNDGSVRDSQRQVHNNLGKSWDPHGPLGPWIVTADEIADPHNLEFRTTVNGEVRQHDNTGNMIHDWEKMIEYA